MPTDTRDHYLALARAELARVKANKCPHGVTTRGVCRECQPTDEESER